MHRIRLLQRLLVTGVCLLQQGLLPNIGHQRPCVARYRSRTGSVMAQAKQAKGVRVTPGMTKTALRRLPKVWAQLLCMSR